MSWYHHVYPFNLLDSGAVEVSGVLAFYLASFSAVASLIGLVIGYYFGSSSRSNDKTDRHRIIIDGKTVSNKISQEAVDEIKKIISASSDEKP